MKAPWPRSKRIPLGSSPFDLTRIDRESHFCPPARAQLHTEPGCRLQWVRSLREDSMKGGPPSRIRPAPELLVWNNRAKPAFWRLARPDQPANRFHVMTGLPAPERLEETARIFSMVMPMPVSCQQNVSRNIMILRPVISSLTSPFSEHFRAFPSRLSEPAPVRRGH